MNLKDLLDHLNSGLPISGDSEMHTFMVGFSHDALRITAELNGTYHEPEEIRALFSELIGKPVDESFGLFPPFTADFGKNITIGKNVFINSGCRFQDQGGITIGDGALIGHNVILGYPESRFCAGEAKHNPSCSYRNRSKCLDWRKRNCSCRCNYW